MARSDLARYKLIATRSDSTVHICGSAINVPLHVRVWQLEFTPALSRMAIACLNTRTSQHNALLAACGCRCGPLAPSAHSRRCSVCQSKMQHQQGKPFSLDLSAARIGSTCPTPDPFPPALLFTCLTLQDQRPRQQNFATHSAGIPLRICM